MAARIQCLLTFDYEVFHGRNYGSDEQVLFEPTDRVLEVCDELGVRVTFFPDVCSVWWHREHGESAFVDRFEAQMRQALAAGHDVQLHVHPHWLACSRRDGRFVLDAEKLYAHELGWGDGEHEAPALFRRCVQYLEDLLRPVDPAYRCTSFRAAALALQPQEQEMLRTLYDCGIRLDTSITKGVHARTGTYVMDYRGLGSKANWWMAPASGIVPAKAGILEVPIGTFRASRAQRVRFLWQRARAFGSRRGEAMSRAERQSRFSGLRQLVAMNLRYLTDDPWFSLSCDTKGFDLQMLVDGFESIVAQHGGEPRIAVSMINHPKLMFAPQRELMRGFVQALRRRHGADLEFTTTTATLASFAPRGD